MIWYQIDISLYFHCSMFWITSELSIHLMYFTSELQTPITFFLWTKTSSVGMHFLIVVSIRLLFKWIVVPYYSVLNILQPRLHTLLSEYH